MVHVLSTAVFSNRKSRHSLTHHHPRLHVPDATNACSTVWKPVHGSLPRQPLAQMNSTGEWGCVATGDTPVICHRISFIPLKGSGLETASPRRARAGGSPARINTSSRGNRGVAAWASSVPWQHDGARWERVESGSDGGEGKPGANVHIRLQGSYPGGERVTSARMQSIECGGALLSLCVSRDDRLVMANVRPFAVSGIRTGLTPGG